MRIPFGVVVRPCGQRGATMQSGCQDAFHKNLLSLSGEGTPK